MKIDHVQFRLLKEILKDYPTDEEQQLIVFFTSSLMIRYCAMAEGKRSGYHSMLKTWYEWIFKCLKNEDKLLTFKVEPLKLCTLWSIVTTQMNRSILGVLATKTEKHDAIAEVVKLMLLYFGVYTSTGNENPRATFLATSEVTKRKIIVKQGLVLEMSAVSKEMKLSSENNCILYTEVDSTTLSNLLRSILEVG